MTTDPSEPHGAAGFGAALVDVGGRFMTSSEMAAAARPFGLEAGALYFRGRTEVLGPLAPGVAGSLLGIFPSWVLEATWRASAGLAAHDLVTAYADACAVWGRNHLAGLADLGAAIELAGHVVDGAGDSALPLFAGWRAAPRPPDPPALAAHLLMLLRELRGGLHFAALRANGLEVPVAVLADPRGGVARLRRTAWRDGDVTALRTRAAAVPDADSLWAAAERATWTAFAQCLSVLTDADRASLGGFVVAAEERTRPG